MSLPDDIVDGDSPHSSLLYLFNHVFLPPKLPDGDDSSPQYDDDLVGVVQACLSAFAETAKLSERDTILEARNTLGSLRRLRDRYGHLREDALCEALQEISSSGTTTLHSKSLRARKCLIYFRLQERNIGTDQRTERRPHHPKRRERCCFRNIRTQSHEWISLDNQRQTC